MLPVRYKLHISSFMIVVLFCFLLDFFHKVDFTLDDFGVFYLSLSPVKCKFSASLPETCTAPVQVWCKFDASYHKLQLILSQPIKWGGNETTGIRAVVEEGPEEAEVGQDVPTEIGNTIPENYIIAEKTWEPGVA